MNFEFDRALTVRDQRWGELRDLAEANRRRREQQLDPRSRWQPARRRIRTDGPAAPALPAPR